MSTVRTQQVTVHPPQTVTDAMVSAGLAESKSEACRLIVQGAVWMHGNRIKMDFIIQEADLPASLAVGKHGLVALVKPADSLESVHSMDENNQLRALLKEVYDLLEDKEPVWYTVGLYKRLRKAIEGTP